jgi:hypothetical protein
MLSNQPESDTAHLIENLDQDFGIAFENISDEAKLRPGIPSLQNIKIRIKDVRDSATRIRAELNGIAPNANTLFLDSFARSYANSSLPVESLSETANRVLPPDLAIELTDLQNEIINFRDTKLR